LELKGICLVLDDLKKNWRWGGLVMKNSGVVLFPNRPTNKDGDEHHGFSVAM
jgi:hypothetical protein